MPLKSFPFSALSPQVQRSLHLDQSHLLRPQHHCRPAVDRAVRQRGSDQSQVMGIPLFVLSPVQKLTVSCALQNKKVLICVRIHRIDRRCRTGTVASRAEGRDESRFKASACRKENRGREFVSLSCRTGERCSMTFKPCGLFGKELHKVEGYILDKRYAPPLISHHSSMYFISFIPDSLPH